MSRKFSLPRVLLVTVAIIAVAVGAGWFFGFLQPVGLYRPANSLMVIEPYRYADTWVFDDKRVGLEQEPFISGIPEMIDKMVADIPNAKDGFRLVFSTQPFPGHELELVWRRPDKGGNWYYCPPLDKEGWLCPALFRYYQKAPERIYVMAEAKRGAS